MKTFRPSRALSAAVLATAVLVTAAGCAVVRDQQSVGSYIDDTTLTTRVKTRFAENRAVSAMAIKVESLNGVVQLAGVPRIPSTSTRHRRHDPKALTLSVAQRLGIEPPLLAAARITLVPAGTVTLRPSMVRLTSLSAQTSGVPKSGCRS